MITPPPPAEHYQFDALAVGWALDALTPDDEAVLDRHRSGGCAWCEQQVVTTLDLAAELAYALPQSDPPPELRSRVLAAASRADRPALRLVRNGEKSRQEPTIARSGRHRAQRRSRWSSGLVAAGLAALVGVGGWQVATRIQGSTPPVTASADRVAALAAPSGGAPVATVLLGSGQATVVTSTLASNTTGRSYVLWGLPAGGGAPQSLGSFTVTATGLHSHLVLLRHPGEAYESLALSQEPVGTPPATPSKVLAAGALTR